METELIPGARQQDPVPQVPNVPEEVGRLDGGDVGVPVGAVDGNADGRAEG